MREIRQSYNKFVSKIGYSFFDEYGALHRANYVDYKNIGYQYISIPKIKAHSIYMDSNNYRIHLTEWTDCNILKYGL